MRTFSLPLSPKGDANKTPWVCPFWAVGIEEENPTMKLTHQLHTIAGYQVHVPVLVNINNLTVGTVLTWNKKDLSSDKLKRARGADGPAKKTKR